MKRSVVVFALLGMLVIALLCLGASETLTNRSGKTASGVVITFAESVRITGYAQTIFPNQAPTCRAERFTFSGGELPNGGRFEVTWTPSSAEIATVSWVPASAPAVQASAPVVPSLHIAAPTLILHNGVVIPMEIEGEYEQAIAVAGDTILAVGSDAEILALATPDTEVVDLQGRTVLPGILDPHTHLFNDAAGLGMTLDEAQQLALENGVTSVANLHTNESETEQFISYAQAGNMRIRLSLYLIYNDSCGIVHGTWYEQYSPSGELAPRLRVGGVKILAERSVCNDEGAHPAISPELVALVPRLHERGWDEWQLMLSPTELRDVVARAQERGYQVAIHAMGDLGIATSLDAIESALHGSPNTYRHMVLHNWILTDELLGRYKELGIGALMEPSSKCERAYRYRNGPEFMRLLSRIRDLVATGAHVALDSDWPNWGPSTISPFVRLRCAVTDTYVPEMIAALEPPCPDIELPTDQTITVWQGLRMMTAEAAYAMRCDDRLGTLRSGKLADLIVVTADPLRVEPETLDQIRVMMTVVGGRIEFEAPDAVAEETPPATTVLYGGTVVSMTSPSDLYEAIAIQGNRVLALGTDEEILALAGPDTERIDLQGRTVLPGFIDPHTHLMKDASAQGFTWDGIQQLAFRNGVTAAAEMFCDQQLLNDLIAYASSGALRLRVFPFLIYNSSCADILGTWYEQYPPFAELAPHLRVGGVKMFAERSICGDTGTVPVFSSTMQAKFPRVPSPDYRGNQLALSQKQLAAAIRRADEEGYPVAIHAIGDGGVEASLRGIIDALAGRPNNLRHMILHGRFVRDDLLPLYARYGILAVMEPLSPCWWTAWIPIIGADNGRYFGRWKDLVESGAHVAGDSDWPFYGEQGFAPLQRLAVTMGTGELDAFGSYQPCAPFPSNQALSAWQGLRMMTVEAAYALHLENELGTLEPGKLADLVVLSANPLEVNSSAVGGIQVLLTMVDGVIEWHSDEFAPQVAASSPVKTVRIATFNTEWLFDGIGDSAWRNAPQTVADADSHFHDVAEWLAELDVDYISLDEVENATVLQRLANDVGEGYTPIFVEGDHPTGQDTCALSRLPVEDYGRSRDSQAFPIEGSGLACSTGTANAPMHYWCDVDIEGIPVTIIGAHLCAYPLDCGRCNQREAEASIIRNMAMHAALDRGREIIILGDLNDYDGDVLDRVGSQPISSVLGILKDIDPNRPGPELVNAVENLPQEDRYSCFWDQNLNGVYDTGEPFTQIDYILVSARLAQYISAVRVDTSRSPGEVSDHWPIVLELTVPRAAEVLPPVAASPRRGPESSMKARVLFDESHSELNTLSPARAQSISREHPEWYLFSNLSRALETNYAVDSEAQWSGPNDLSAFDVLVIAAPQDDFTPNDRAAVVAFVEGGGGLLLMADGGPAQALVHLASAFGIDFALSVVCSNTPDWDPQSFWADSLDSSHAITRGSEAFHTNWGCAIDLRVPGATLVASGKNTWLDEDEDGRQDANERIGPFALAVALEYGAGRIVGIADNAFHDGMFAFPGNRSLILHAIEWLADENGPRTASSPVGDLSLAAVDDFEDGDFATPLGAPWETCPEEDWAAGGAGWHDFSAQESVQEGLAVRRSGSEVVEHLGDRVLAWSFTGTGLVKLGVGLSGPPGFDASNFEGIYVVASADAELDVMVCVDYRQAGTGSPDNWDRRSSTANLRVKRDEKQELRIPFSQFALDDPVWKVSEGDTLEDVDRRCLDFVGLMVLAQDGKQSIYIHEIGFYGP